MNHWTGIGRLTRDSELVIAKNGTEICKFTVAINRRFNREETDFIDVICFKKLAINCSEYLHKGSQCAVSGTLQIGSYENQEGKKIKTVQIVADEVEFLSPKGDKPATKTAEDQWSDLGKEVRLEDIDMIEESESEIPF